MDPQIPMGQGYTQITRPFLEAAVTDFKEGKSEYAKGNLNIAKTFLENSVAAFFDAYGSESVDDNHVEALITLGYVLLDLLKIKGLPHNDNSIRNTAVDNFELALLILYRRVLKKTDEMLQTPGVLDEDFQDSILLINLQIQRIKVLIRMSKRKLIVL